MRHAKITTVRTNNELSARDRYAVTQTEDAIRIKDEVSPESPLEIDLAGYFILHCSYDDVNDIEDHDLLILLSKSGEKYQSSSSTLISSIIEMDENLDDLGDSIFGDPIRIVKIPSKNQPDPFLKAIL